MPTDTFDPTTLAVDQCRTLDEPELAVAVALRILGDDLKPRYIGDPRWCARIKEFNDNRGRGICDDPKEFAKQWRAEPPKLTNDLAVSMFDEGMPLQGCVIESPEEHDDPWAVEIYQIPGPLDSSYVIIGEGTTFRIAVFRAALVRAVSGEWKRPKKRSLYVLDEGDGPSERIAAMERKPEVRPEGGTE